MRITLKQLSVFAAIAKHENISQAANEAALTQSAMSMALKELESQLNSPLFHRHGKRLKLNNTGLALQPRVQQLLQLAEEIERLALQDELSGVLRIGASSTIGNYLVPAIIAEFLEANPDVHIDLKVANTQQIVDDMKHLRIDLGLIEGLTDAPQLDKKIWRHDELKIFAAHDTTTSTLNHLILHLAEHPEWQDKLRAEARNLGRDALTYEDLDNIELYELVFKETLRMNPSVSIMQRRTMKEVEIDGHRVPADTVIFIPPVYNHFMPEYWSNPEKFDPYRFAEGREEHKSHSFAYMPFGGGAHKCIGMHFANMIVKCFLHQMLLTYEWSVEPGYKPKLEAFPLPKTSDGLPLILKKIDG